MCWRVAILMTHYAQRGLNQIVRVQCPCLCTQMIRLVRWCNALYDLVVSWIEGAVFQKSSPKDPHFVRSVLSILLNGSQWIWILYHCFILYNYFIMLPKAVNNATGAATQMAGLITSLVMLCLGSVKIPDGDCRLVGIKETATTTDCTRWM